MLENFGFKLNNISHVSAKFQRLIQPVKNNFFENQGVHFERLYAFYLEKMPSHLYWYLLPGYSG